MLVYIRGAGMYASGIAVRLFRANCKIVMSDYERPKALRRKTCFSEALRTGRTTVEGIEAAAARDPEEAVRILRQNKIAVIKDPEGDMRGTLPFDACIDATLSEKATDTSMKDAPIVVGIGERFSPGTNCHASVAVDLPGERGRVSYAIDPESEERPDAGKTTSDSTFFRVSKAGLFYPVSEIGDTVQKGETLGVVDDEPVLCPADGVLAGILPEGTPIKKEEICGEILTGAFVPDLSVTAEETLAVAGGVLEALLHFREAY